MAIRAFVLILLVLSVTSYFIPVKNIVKKNSEQEIPLLVFNDSTMYTLTTDSMNRIVYAKEVFRFKERDVMHEGALTLKKLDKDNNYVTDVLYSDVIVKRADIYKFFKNVRFRRDNIIALDTDELFYNVKDEVVTNTLPFNGIYNNNLINGENLYLDMKSYYMKSNNTHFEIDMKK
ncbi:hypothetical protein [Halarcobacter bivalviorum]|uniref:Lipooligosaccharide transport system, periplasmic component LptC n=1 Tax=Halarcobacter bivalviorum TaxID=663364 RepID=A0AAX2A9H3_9BACT|nr:hypothetical protein [Halarcobacter bivalviorum]AXH12502.1 lipooligosaccharide transport system, periplasmic component LptC [Halarcobacter bivalviorum]RXK10575.1 hypothetical protein CRV05_04655 [Halarcobacter bivalviorum]